MKLKLFAIILFTISAGIVKAQQPSGIVPDSLGRIVNSLVKVKRDSIVKATVDSMLNARLTGPFKKFYLSAGVIFGSAWSSVLVDTAYFSNTDALTRREQGDTKITGLRSWGLSANWILSDNTTQQHVIYVDFGEQYMGFDSRYNKINWQSGLPESVNTVVHYKLKSYSVGLGYKYSTANENSVANFLLNAGVYYSLNTKYSATRADDGTAIDNSSDKYSIINNRISARIGIGITIGTSWIRPYILPVYQWELTPVNRGQLGTRLHVWGINAGVLILFPESKNKATPQRTNTAR